MIILIDNPATRNKCKEVATANVMFGAKEAQEMYLRRQFDCACVDATALAVIDVAISLGYIDLADEMRNDFYVETGKEAV